MSTPDGPPVQQVRLDDDATPRPEEEVAAAGDAGVGTGPETPEERRHASTGSPTDHGGAGGAGEAADPLAQPAAGGTAGGPPAQGEGAPDSY